MFLLLRSLIFSNRMRRRKRALFASSINKIAVHNRLRRKMNTCKKILHKSTIESSAVTILLLFFICIFSLILSPCDLKMLLKYSGKMEKISASGSYECSFFRIDGEHLKLWANEKQYFCNIYPAESIRLNRIREIWRPSLRRVNILISGSELLELRGSSRRFCEYFLNTMEHELRKIIDNIPRKVDPAIDFGPFQVGHEKRVRVKTDGIYFLKVH